MNLKWLSELQGTERPGKGELWLDPEGNTATHFECSLKVETDTLHYTWAYEGETKHGSFSFSGEEVIWMDSWHQQEPVKCEYVSNAWGMFTVLSLYGPGAKPDWGWRSKFSERPNGDLVLQMTNIAPWGEEARAFRMVFTAI